MIVTFANQKGGVGKTTLTILFANYLAKIGVQTLLVDCDHQRSLVHLRTTDKKNFPEQTVPYEIVELDLSNEVQVRLFCQELKASEEITLMDAPGNLTEEGLLQIFAASDFIVIPFQYERKCIDSTGVLISALDQITQHLSKKPQLLFSPNKIRTNEGIKSEKDMWAQFDEALGNYGIVLPPVKELSCLKRVNTLISTKEQELNSLAALDKLYSTICKKVNH